MPTGSATGTYYIAGQAIAAIASKYSPEITMVALYAATRAIYEALKVLKETRDVKALETRRFVVGAQRGSGVNHVETTGLELLPQSELFEMYGTLDLQEILNKEFKETVTKWEEKKNDGGSNP